MQEFESQELGVSSEQWVLYFNSPLEMDRFVQALSTVWKEVYQVSGHTDCRYRYTIIIMSVSTFSPSVPSPEMV